MTKAKKVNEEIGIETATKMFDAVKNAQSNLTEITSKFVAEDVAHAQNQVQHLTEVSKGFAEKALAVKSVTDLYELNTEVMKTFGNIFMDNLNQTQAKLSERTEVIASSFKQ